MNLVRGLLGIIYPLHCGACGSDGGVLCKQCVDSFRPVEQNDSCPVCGRWLGHRIVCGSCIREKGAFEEGLYGFYFENKLRDAVHSFKFTGRKDVGKRLVGLMKEKIIPFSEKFDCIVPMPVTEKRLKKRGFNQSFIVAEEISGITGKPVYHAILQKTKETKDQYSLARDERRKNVRGVFALSDGREIRGKRVLLVDDLYTTGATAREASRTLMRGKTRTVVLFALARTP